MRQRQGGLAFPPTAFSRNRAARTFRSLQKQSQMQWSTILHSYIAKVAFRRVLQNPV